MNCKPTRILRNTLLLLPVALLAGCASYSPLPLKQRPDLLNTVPALQVDANKLGLPMLAGHRFNPDNGLDMTEVATLAVINNPQLKVARRHADVARAQLFAARLLPDPQLSVASDRPTGNTSGLTNAYNLGLNYDLTQLITRGAHISAARAASNQVNLEVLWQEWQVVQQARTLYVQAVFQSQKLRLLRHIRRLYAERYARSARALKEGNMTLDVAGTDLTALLDADTQIYQLEKQNEQIRHALNALLGLSPKVQLVLTPPGQPVMLPATVFARAMKQLPGRRPDLLAMQAGYRSQEANVHAAILAQFPSISVGITRARDTGNVHTTGFGITLNLPFLNGNRGQIAIARATRAQLWQDYQARLDGAYSQLDLLRKQQQLMQAQNSKLAQHLPELERMVHRARRAYDARDIAALTYLNMENTLLNKKLETTDLEQALWESRIAQDTLLAWPDGTKQDAMKQDAMKQGAAKQ